MSLTDDRNTDVKLSENAFKNRQNLFSQTNKNNLTGQNFIFKDDKNQTDTKEHSTYVKSTKQDSMSLTGDKNKEIKLSENAFKNRMIMFTEKPKEPRLVRGKTADNLPEFDTNDDKSGPVNEKKNFEETYDVISVIQKKLPKKKSFNLDDI